MRAHSVTIIAAQSRARQTSGWRRPNLWAALAPALIAGAAIAVTYGLAPLSPRASMTVTIGPVYTVAQVYRQALRDPAGWSGRQVMVRGRAVTYRAWSAPDSIVTRIELIDPQAMQVTQVTQVTGSMVRLPLIWGRPDPLLAGLRRLPLVGQLAPPPQRPHWGVTALYRVQLLALARGPSPNIAAVLLDVPPADQISRVGQ